VTVCGTVHPSCTSAVTVSLPLSAIDQLAWMVNSAALLLDSPLHGGISFVAVTGYP